MSYIFFCVCACVCFRENKDLCREGCPSVRAHVASGHAVLSRSRTVGLHLTWLRALCNAVIYIYFFISKYCAKLWPPELLNKVVGCKRELKTAHKRKGLALAISKAADEKQKQTNCSARLRRRDKL